MRTLASLPETGRFPSAVSARRRPLRAVVATGLAAAMVLLAACSSAEDEAVVTDEPATEQPDAEPDDDAEPDTAPDEDAGAAALEVFLGAQATCEAYADDMGNPAPDPARFQDVTIVEVRDATTVVLDDGLGERFVVDLGAAPATISGIDGPDAVLPRDLSFGCPPELFLGSADS